MKNIALFIGFCFGLFVGQGLFCNIAHAAPFLVSDPYPLSLTPQPTHCGVYISAAARVDSPVAKDSTTGAVSCRHDLAAFPVGTATVKATYIVRDPSWPVDEESGYSNPLSVTRPGKPAFAPGGLKIEK